MKKIVLSFLLATFFVGQASAGILLEPYLGYNFNGTIEEGPSNSDVDEHEYSGLTYGGRLGFTMAGFMGGFDYSASSYTLEQTKDPGSATNSDVGNKQDASHTRMGLFVGYELPIMFRFWATYFFKTTMEVDGQANNTVDLGGTGAVAEYDGSGFGIGLGYTAIPMLSFNFEYRVITYDELSFSGATAALPVDGNATLGTMGEQEATEMIFSVSIPLNF
ncbi:MAG: hypothetical protein HN509_16005 [Halobacteriovoraceae bacterium]|jgi:hypothetical protein|nr:hypothetical protein [Halobacteriovoraceae bacterium]MBT5094109.1 hypothetical protein [Halobacteriovoraceae bacterium]